MRRRSKRTHSIGDEASTRRRRRQSQERRKPAELALGLSLLSGLPPLSSLAKESRANRHRKGTEEDERAELLELCVLGLVARDGGAGGVERVELAVRSGVEEVVLADAEDLDHLLVEARHHARLGSALAHADEAVDVLSRAEGLLPELEIDGRVELLEARVEVALEGIGVVEVDRV